ncbi:MAG TPA: NADH-ubiquinone oxidoreductase-F iron-sulfur binding region domain-containing protein [Candidatus Binataceae bacterium]|nr:NADH-ubiquinone oxidoreductase-F iron-sulfur binding region domain-containing protein [Candidatus Binataceae bacterium]
MSSARTAIVYVPGDSSARSLGADAVARALSDEAAGRRLNIKLIRNGSRGLYWLEPMVEVETPRGRMAYGPVTSGDVPSLFDAGFLEGGEHPRALGVTGEIVHLQRQHRVTFARVGVTDPISLDDYLVHGGYRGLARALVMSGAEIVQEITTANLRGRGGAAFPAGIKWKTTLDQQAQQKYVVCNADEGDSGTFSDRMIMEGDPFVLIEGMTIAAAAVGASDGYIYLRSEYPDALRTLNAAIEAASRAGYLGANVCGSGRAFRLQVRVGAGAYICGEETAMLESLEGKRGVIRFKPPLPAIAGLFGQPTVVNNVITLATVPAILENGGESYNALGVGRSRGTLPLQLAGNVKRPGLFELPFGLSLRELIFDFGGGTASGRPLRAVQVGGPLGAYFPESMLDLAIDYEALAGAGGLLGHGGVVVFDDTADLARMARYAMEFCALESCGKCTPCRIGSTRGVEVIDRIIANRDRSANVELLRDLCETMTAGSLCALGGLTPLPVLSALKYFPQDFGLPAEKSAMLG